MFVGNKEVYLRDILLLFLLEWFVVFIDFIGGAVIHNLTGKPLEISVLLPNVIVFSVFTQWLMIADKEVKVSEYKIASFLFLTCSSVFLITDVSFLFYNSLLIVFGLILIINIDNSRMLYRKSQDILVAPFKGNQRLPQLINFVIVIFASIFSFFFALAFLFFVAVFYNKIFLPSGADINATYKVLMAIFSKLFGMFVGVTIAISRTKIYAAYVLSAISLVHPIVESLLFSVSINKIDLGSSLIASVTILLYLRFFSGITK